VMGLYFADCQSVDDIIAALPGRQAA
jgi:hypothetical protein